MKRELCDRTKAFALRIVRLSAALPHTREVDVIAKQVLRSGTSVGAQCREAYSSRSKAELISKLESALQELDETSARVAGRRRVRVARQACVADAGGGRAH